MWQAESFDEATLMREVALAGSLGFTSMRVFLHDLAFAADSEGFLARLERFLEIAHAQRLGTLFVLFDGVWNPYPRAGSQPAPRPGVHNAGWLQSPGSDALADPGRHDALEGYIRAVLHRFRDDERVDGWDLFNEPDNPNPAYRDVEVRDKEALALVLLEKSFDWARAVRPAQPLTAGLWRGEWDHPATWSPMNRACIEQSDVLSFHCYGPLDELERRVAALARLDRPILCTEFMARSLGSTFDPHLGWMKQHDIGAYAWGLVAGRTQTHYPWESWLRRTEGEPAPWFHDLFRADGGAYDPDEVAYIRSLTGGPPGPEP